MTWKFVEQPTNNETKILGGLPVRTDLRGGVCVDVNDEVKSALQTLTNALGGTTTAAATTVNTTAAS